MKRVVLLTGTELRHTFFRKALGLAEGIEVVRSYCESGPPGAPAGTPLASAHLAARAQSEEDFFGVFARLAPDLSHPVPVPRGTVNHPSTAREIAALAPDGLVAYGCSIVRDPLLTAFSRRFLNVHLGLSPYYRGSGTNFWPLVNGEPEYVGATFLHLDAGIDTGEILHQVRARIFPGDGPHSIGNRLIADAAAAAARVIRRFEELYAVPQPKPLRERVYRRKDFCEDATRELYAQFAGGLVERYLAEAAQRTAVVPIVQHPVLALSEMSRP